MTRARDAADQINRVNSSAANATAITIDSSENVLVGKTVADTTTLGNTVYAGIVSATMSNDPAIFANRAQDGSIIELQQSGSTVGSIAASGGLLVIGDADCGIAFEDGTANHIYPWNVSGGGANDGNISLGASSARFKDLYLSGGVFLGGTGASNKLDDYEEGDWSPGTGQGTISAQYAKYTKIGRSVTVSALIHNISDQSSSSVFAITNLPFTSCSTCRSVGAIMMRYQNNTSLTAAYITANTTNVEFYGVVAGGWDVALHSDWNNTNSEVYFTVTYNTDA